MAERALLKRRTLRERLRQQIEQAHPSLIVQGEDYDFTKARLMDALSRVPLRGLAKVGDLRRFYRAVDRSRPILNNTQPEAVATLAETYPMSIPDDTLLRGGLALLGGGVDEVPGLLWAMVYYVDVPEWEGNGAFTQDNDACAFYTADEAELYRVSEMDDLSYPAIDATIRTEGGAIADDGYYAAREYAGPGLISGEVRVFRVTGGIVDDYETCN